MLSTSQAILRKVELVRDRVEDWGRFPFCLPILREFEELEFHPKVTFLVGENGSGKSTLLEAIAMAAGLNAEGGTRNFRSVHRASESGLDAYLRLGRGPRQEKTALFQLIRPS